MLTTYDRCKRAAAAGKKARFCEFSSTGLSSPKFLFKLLSQKILLDLARDGHGEGVHEPYVARYFVVRDCSAAVRANFLGVGDNSLLKSDEGTNLFTELVIG